MNIDRLYQILRETTCQLRNGDKIEGTPELVEQIKRGDTELKGGGVVEIYDMPHVSEARPDIERVDVEFVVIGVNRAKAEEHRAEFVEILKQWPQPERLAGGPSYIEVGGVIGDQGAAFELFALGKVLGLWDVITPTSLGFSGDEARRMAGSGLVMMTGFRAAA